MALTHKERAYAFGLSAFIFWAIMEVMNADGNPGLGLLFGVHVAWHWVPEMAGFLCAGLALREVRWLPRYLGALVFLVIIASDYLLYASQGFLLSPPQVMLGAFIISPVLAGSLLRRPWV